MIKSGHRPSIESVEISRIRTKGMLQNVENSSYLLFQILLEMSLEKFLDVGEVFFDDRKVVTSNDEPQRLNVRDFWLYILKPTTDFKIL